MAPAGEGWLGTQGVQVLGLRSEVAGGQRSEDEGYSEEPTQLLSASPVSAASLTPSSSRWARVCVRVACFFSLISAPLSLEPQHRCPAFPSLSPGGCHHLD